MGKRGKGKEERVDANHRFPLRIDQSIYKESQTLCFQRLSANLLFNEMIAYCIENESFIEMIRTKYPRDERLGHYVFIKNGQ